jgi:hypothetical protein
MPDRWQHAPRFLPGNTITGCNRTPANRGDGRSYRWLPYGLVSDRNLPRRLAVGESLDDPQETSLHCSASFDYLVGDWELRARQRRRLDCRSTGRAARSGLGPRSMRIRCRRCCRTGRGSNVMLDGAKGTLSEGTAPGRENKSTHWWLRCTRKDRGGDARRPVRRELCPGRRIGCENFGAVPLRPRPFRLVSQSQRCGVQFGHRLLSDAEGGLAPRTAALSAGFSISTLWRSVRPS